MFESLNHIENPCRVIEMRGYIIPNRLGKVVNYRDNTGPKNNCQQNYFFSNTCNMSVER